jgi:hypothetical protein
VPGLLNLLHLGYGAQGLKPHSAVEIRIMVEGIPEFHKKLEFAHHVEFTRNF